VTLSYLDRVRLSVGEGAVSGDVFRGRNHRFSFAAGIETGDLVGSVGYAFTSFGRPESGSAGTYWEPDISVAVSGHRVIAGDGALFYGHCGLFDLPSIQQSRWRAIEFDLTPAGSGRVTVSAFDEVRLFPRVYLQATATLGLGFGQIPPPLLFHLGELVSFWKRQGGGWIATTSPGAFKLSGSLALELPASEELFNVVNVMMIDGVRGRAFVAGGACWTRFDEFGKTIPSVEVGVEALVELSAIGGLLPLYALVGVATPVLGEGTSIFYFGLSLQ